MKRKCNLNNEFQKMIQIEDLDLSMFMNFRLSQITCWEELEMYASIAGVELNSSLMKFLISVSYYSDVIAKTTIEGIMNNHVLRLFDNTSDAVHFIYKIFNMKSFSHLHMMKLLTYFNQQTNDDLVSNIDPLMMLDHKYMSIRFEKLKLLFFTAIDKIDQYALLKFYSKYSRVLQQYDIKFVLYVKQMTKKKAYNDQNFQKIYLALENEISNQQIINMHIQ